MITSTQRGPTRRTHRFPRDHRRVVAAALVAALLSGAPSTLYALQAKGVRGAWEYGRDASAAIATLVPPWTPNVLRGAVVHFAIALAVGEFLGVVLPRRNSVGYGAVAGLAIGVLDIGIIGRRFPAIAELELGPQLADHAAFGAIFATVVDRSDTP